MMRSMQFLRTSNANYLNHWVEFVDLLQIFSRQIVGMIWIVAMGCAVTIVSKSFIFQHNAQAEDEQSGEQHYSGQYGHWKLH